MGAMLYIDIEDVNKLLKELVDCMLNNQQEPIDDTIYELREIIWRYGQ